MMVNKSTFTVATVQYYSIFRAGLVCGLNWPYQILSMLNFDKFWHG